MCNYANENNAANASINNNKTTTSKSFEYKTKLIGRTSNDNNTLDAEVFTPLKYLSNFWRSLDLPLINCEKELDLSCSKKCIISEMSITPRIAGNQDANPPALDVAAIQTTGAIFQINNVKLYVPVVALSINDNIKFLENIKQEFKRTVSLNKFRSEIIPQTKKNNLDHLVDPTFKNIGRLFVFSFKTGNDDPTKSNFDEYYMSLVKSKISMH